MKKQLYFFLALFFIQAISSPVQGQIDIKHLVGEWEFVELRDEKGNKIDTLFDENSYMVANGPKYTFKKDSTYDAQFTPVNINKGTWSFKSITNEIILKSYWEKPYNEIDLYVISLGLIKKDDDGSYYDLVPIKVIEINPGKLIISENGHHIIVYKRIN